MSAVLDKQSVGCFIKRPCLRRNESEKDGNILSMAW